MRSITRKAAVTAGLGAALVATGAGTAMAQGMGNAGTLNPQLPSEATQQLGLGNTFPVSAPTDQLPTGALSSLLGQATQQGVPQAQHVLPQTQLPGGLPPVG